MAIVVGETIKVNGYEVGTVAECKCSVPRVFDVSYDRPKVYVIK